MVFPSCPSMKRLFQGSPRRPWESSSGVPDGLSPLPVEERAIPGAPPEGPDNLWREYSRWPFSLACRGNGDFSTSPEVSERPQRKCLFTLPVEGKAIPERPKQRSASVFPPCLSRKSHIDASEVLERSRRMQNPLPVDEKGFANPSRSPRTTIFLDWQREKAIVRCQSWGEQLLEEPVEERPAVSKPDLR